MSSESHVAFHVTAKEIARMEVSSSSGRMRASCEATVNMLTKVFCCEVVCLKMICAIYCLV